MQAVIEQSEEIETLLNEIDFNMIWPGFKKFKYALYDDRNYYMNGKIGNRDERFMGNSTMNFNGENIAIWDMSSINEYKSSKKIVSGIVHEMFHCFQAEYGEKRHANEILGIDYPIEPVNINLRSVEREFLYRSAIEQNSTEKLDLLKEFFNVRAQREKVIGTFLGYEKAIETFEGAAVFVEFQALKQLCTDNDILAEFLTGFTDVSIANLAIRRSSYFQGMILCMITDELLPDWKIEFQNSGLYLSDFIKNKLKIEPESTIEARIISEEVISCIDEWEDNVDKEFKDFDRFDNIQKLEGIFVTGFDPMNIIKRGNEYMHKHFLRINQDGQDKIINGPVKMVCGENMFDVKRIEYEKE